MAKHKLKRELGLLEATCYGVGIILGAGIYALIGKAAGMAGPALWLSFLTGAIIASITGLSYAELGTIFPKEAAEYVYVKRVFNNNRLAFILSWLIMFVGIVAISAVSLGFGGYLEAITGIPMVWGALILVTVMSFLNFWGIKESARANIIFTLVELAGLLIIIYLGLPYFGAVDYFEMPNGFEGVMGGAVLIFFAYLGFEDIVNMAEEMKKPRKIIPKALVLSILITTVIYILVAISAVSLVGWEQLSWSNAPLAEVAGAALPGMNFDFIFSIIALFATANTVLILLIVESRMIWGVANNHSLPQIFSKLHSWRKTPWVAIITAALIVSFFITSWDITSIAQITDFGAFIIFAAVNACLIGYRIKAPNFKRTFRVPINIGKFPVLPAIGIIFSLYMLTHFESTMLLYGTAVIISGWVVYEAMLKLKWIRG